MSDHERLDVPEELRPHPFEDEAPPRRSVGVRVAVVVVVLALILMTVGVWIVQSGIIFPM